MEKSKHELIEGAELRIKPTVVIGGEEFTFASRPVEHGMLEAINHPVDVLSESEIREAQDLENSRFVELSNLKSITRLSGAVGASVFALIGIDTLPSLGAALPFTAGIVTLGLAELYGRELDKTDRSRVEKHNEKIAHRLELLNLMQAKKIGVPIPKDRQ